MRVLALALLLAACTSPSDQPAGFSADDQRELNEAAEMLDANSISADAVSTNESPAP